MDFFFSGDLLETDDPRDKYREQPVLIGDQGIWYSTMPFVDTVYDREEHWGISKNSIVFSVLQVFFIFFLLFYRVISNCILILIEL